MESDGEQPLMTSTLLLLFSELLVPGWTLGDLVEEAPWKVTSERDRQLAVGLVTSALWHLVREDIVMFEPRQPLKTFWGATIMHGYVSVTRKIVKVPGKPDFIRPVLSVPNPLHGIEGRLVAGMGYGDVPLRVTDVVRAVLDWDCPNPWWAVVMIAAQDAARDGYATLEPIRRTVLQRVITLQGSRPGHDTVICPNSEKMAALASQARQVAWHWQNFERQEPALHAALSEDVFDGINGRTFTSD